MKLWRSLLGRDERLSIDDYAQLFGYNGLTYALTGGASSHSDREAADAGFSTRIATAYKANGVIFACVLLRVLVLSEARFQWQQLVNGRPGDLFGTPDLGLLERPWPNGTTGELIARMEQDASFAGNAYIARERDRLRRLRPDWVNIILSVPPAEAVASDVVGYQYTPGGAGSRAEPVVYLPEQVAHWTPIPDPDAQYRGMSWITSVISEIAADKAATKHKLKFFENGSSPQLAVTFNEKVTEAQFKAFIKATNEAHQGVDNAYKNLYLGGGANVTVIGKDLQQLDFKATQGAGETRIAAAAGTPPVLVGLSEGLQGSSLNTGNYSAAKRRFADATARPLWRSMAAALETVVTPPAASRLWYDARDVAFLREDAKDLADIESERAATIAALVSAGFKADDVVTAVMSGDLSLLKGSHTGLFSVQLQPPGTSANGNGSAVPAIAK